MIVACPKAVTELKQLIDRHKKVLFVGCGTCVTVCLAGGEREVGIAAYAIRMARKLAGKPLELTRSPSSASARTSSSRTWPSRHRARRRHRLVRLRRWACRPSPSGSPTSPSTPASTPKFLGILEEQAVWTEKCLGCGDCMLAEFGGICPVTRCAKRLLNGPCGGSTEEHCEVDRRSSVRLAAHLQAS